VSEERNEGGGRGREVEERRTRGHAEGSAKGSGEPWGGERRTLLFVNREAGRVSAKRLRSGVSRRVSSRADDDDDDDLHFRWYVDRSFSSFFSSSSSSSPLLLLLHAADHERGEKRTRSNRGASLRINDRASGSTNR